MVTFDAVSMRYGGGPLVLHDVNLVLQPGSFHFLVGPSGAGKSSLLRLMFLAQRPTGGRISLFGRDVNTMSRREMALTRRRIGVVFQDFRLIPHLSVTENVALPLKVTGAWRRRRMKDVRDILAWVGLAEHLDVLPETLSGGQQQRVAIARALIAQPDLLVADEPTGNVDDQIAFRLLYLLQELNKMGTTIVIATHNEALVSRAAYPVLRIEEGAVYLTRGGDGVDLDHGPADADNRRGH